MSDKEKKQKKETEFTTMESRLIVKDERRMFGSKNKNVEILEILDDAYHFIYQSNEYEKVGALVFSLVAHDLEAMELLGNLEKNWINIDSKKIKMIVEQNKQLMKAIAVFEQQKQNPMIKFLNRDK